LLTDYLASPLQCRPFGIPRLLAGRALPCSGVSANRCNCSVYWRFWGGGNTSGQPSCWLSRCSTTSSPSASRARSVQGSAGPVADRLAPGLPGAARQPPSAPLASASLGLHLSLSASSVFVPTILSGEPEFSTIHTSQPANLSVWSVTSRSQPDNLRWLPPPCH